jgi:hypothetical protein
MLSGNEADVVAAIENGDLAVLQKTLSQILKPRKDPALPISSCK